ncbi:MAG: hypothetical protein ACP5I8_07615 [Phycisphaerae bacterium]
MTIKFTRYFCGAVFFLGLCGLLSGCTHVAGMATWQGTSFPAAGAELSLGPPGSTFTRHYYPVNKNGHFSFWISALDTDNLWVWSGRGSAAINAVQLDPSQISDHMAIAVPRRLLPSQ